MPVIIEAERILSMQKLYSNFESEWVLERNGMREKIEHNWQ